MTKPPEKRRYQSGQSMIEYTVILMALTALLVNVSGDPDESTLGLSSEDKNTLMYSVHQRYTAQDFGLRVSELPERENLDDITNYYDELEKFPDLSKKLNSVASSINTVTEAVDDIESNISTLSNYDLDAVKDDVKSLAEDQFKDALKDFF